jgi:hypothetical protein
MDFGDRYKYMCIYIMCVYIYIYIYIYTHTQTYIYVWAYAYTCVYTCVCIHTHTHTHTYSEVCYNKWMLKQTLFINKIMMLQWTWRNTISRCSTHVCVRCQVFQLWLVCQLSPSLLSVRFSYKFSSVICLFLQCIKVK